MAVVVHCMKENHLILAPSCTFLRLRVTPAKLPIWALLGRLYGKAKSVDAQNARQVSSCVFVQQSCTLKISMRLHGHVVRGVLPCAIHSVKHHSPPGFVQGARPASRAPIRAVQLFSSPKKCWTSSLAYSVSSRAADSEASMAPSTQQLAWQVCCLAPQRSNLFYCQQEPTSCSLTFVHFWDYLHLTGSPCVVLDPEFTLDVIV